MSMVFATKNFIDGYLAYNSVVRTLAEQETMKIILLGNGLIFEMLVSSKANCRQPLISFAIRLSS